MRIIANPEHVYVDTRDNKILYTYPSTAVSTDKDKFKIVVEVNYFSKKKTVLNYVNTSLRVPADVFKDAKSYLKIK